MLPLDPPPRYGHRHPAGWVGLSAILHGLLVIGAIAAARYLPEYLPVHAGGTVLASMGGVFFDGEDFAHAAQACARSSSLRPAQREGKAFPYAGRVPMLSKLNELLILQTSCGLEKG